MGKHRKKSDRSDAIYETGYGKPPKATRFQAGNCANPKGRPKKPKFDPLAFLRKSLEEKVDVVINGRSVRMSKHEASLINITNLMVKDPIKAYKAFGQMVAHAFAAIPPDEVSDGIDHRAEVRRKIEAVAQRLAAERADEDRIRL